MAQLSGQRSWRRLTPAARSVGALLSVARGCEGLRPSGIPSTLARATTLALPVPEIGGVFALTEIEVSLCLPGALSQ
jgi:hypothetical protein